MTLPNWGVLSAAFCIYSRQYNLLLSLLRSSSPTKPKAILDTYVTAKPPIRPSLPFVLCLHGNSRSGLTTATVGTPKLTARLGHYTTDCGVSECGRETSTTRRPWSTGGGGGFAPPKKKKCKFGGLGWGGKPQKGGGLGPRGGGGQLHHPTKKNVISVC